MYKSSLYIGCGFLLLYSGYNALQTLLPLERPTVGPLTIALSYVAYSLAALILPASTPLLRRCALTISAITFVFWIWATTQQDWVLAVASVLNGAGAGVLWTTEGAWLASITSEVPEQAGRVSSIVLVCFHAATIAGQLSAHYLQAFYWQALLTAGLATLLFLCAPNAWLGCGQSHGWYKFKALVSSPWLEQLAAIVLFGWTSALIWVGMPEYLADQLVWGYCAFAATSVVTFLIAGWVVDRWPRRYLVWLACGLHCMLWGFVATVEAESALAIGCMAVAGLANSLLNQTIVHWQMTMIEAELRPSAFAAQVFVYCLAYASGAALVAWQIRLLLWQTACFALLPIYFAN